MMAGEPFSPEVRRGGLHVNGRFDPAHAGRSWLMSDESCDLVHEEGPQSQTDAPA